MKGSEEKDSFLISFASPSWEKQKEILDSINYAKRIQMALLPNEKYIERNLNKMRPNS